MRLSHANRLDANQAEIISALRAVGASVQPMSKIGDGCADILVGIRGRNLVIEIKSGLREPLTDMQKKWHANWRGQVCTIFSVEDAIALVNSVR